MAAFRISSLVSGPGVNCNTFFPFPMQIVETPDRMSQAFPVSIFSFLASVLPARVMLFCSKNLRAFLQEAQPFLRYAQLMSMTHLHITNG